MDNNLNHPLVGDDGNNVMTWNKKYSYYNTKKVVNNLGKWDSKFEAGYAQELDLRLKAKDIAGYESHVRMPLNVNGYHICDYYVDFQIFHNDGTTEFTELKGYSTEVFRIKWKIFCALYEDDSNYKLTLIMQGKQRPPKIRKVKK